MADQVGGREPKGRIVVAEDEPHIRRILITMLEVADYEVVAFPDGDEALDYLAGDGHVDLVITDLMMPRTSGLEVLAGIGKMSHRARMPVLMLTAKGQDADRDSAFELGAIDFITKPFSPKKLIARIDEILQG